MANYEDIIRDLREKNSELALEVQSLKILNTQKDKEKLQLTKEVNDLRLKLSRLRSGGAAQARKLDAGLQAASEEALSHLVQASGAVARTMEIAKQYILERQELDSISPRWSNLASSNNEKVNKVPPLMLGGQSIQPVVSLSRTMLNNGSLTRSPNQNRGVTHRALPIHMLQDVYIPLTRIDAELQANVLEPEDNNIEMDNSSRQLGLEDNEELADFENEEPHENTSSMDDGLDDIRVLDAVLEDSAELDEESEMEYSGAHTSAQNPLEGPSWLLDVASSSRMEGSRVWSRPNLEPDSTTPCETPAVATTTHNADNPPEHTEGGLDVAADAEAGNVSLAIAFTPTVRRRKRTSSPPATYTPAPTPAAPPLYSPPPSDPPPPPHQHRVQRKSSSGRVLKVVVAKMRLSEEEAGGSDGASFNASLPKRLAMSPKSPRRSASDVEVSSPRRSDRKEVRCRPRFDAPSPNGATDSAVIVCETTPPTNSSNTRLSRRDFVREAHTSPVRCGAGAGVRSRSASRSVSRLDSDSDQSSTSEQDTRTRRTRKQVSYKEKPLNRKLRR